MSVNQQTEITLRLIAARKAELVEAMRADTGCTRKEFDEQWVKHKAYFYAIETAYTREVVARYLREGILIAGSN